MLERLHLPYQFFRVATHLGRQHFHGADDEIGIDDEPAANVLLDVREASEVTSADKIEGAVNVPIRTLTKSLASGLNAWTAANRRNHRT